MPPPTPSGCAAEPRRAVVNVTVTGATGLIGSRLVAALLARGDRVTVLSRDPERATRGLGVAAVRWDPRSDPAPSEALAGRDAVVHLAGESVAQRWSEAAKRRIHTSRETGTAHLVGGLRAADPRPATLVSASAVGYYGPRGAEEIDEREPAGGDFLAGVCVAWEREAAKASELGMRVATLRTGIVLDAAGGALRAMLPPFRLGIGGPVAGGHHRMPWIHIDDLIALYLAACDGDERWSGPLNASAPQPVTNAEFSRALGRVLGRPAVVPVPALLLRVRYGEMSEIVTTGQNAVPRRALELGHEFRRTDLDEALRAALA